MAINTYSAIKVCVQAKLDDINCNLCLKFEYAFFRDCSLDKYKRDNSSSYINMMCS